MNLQEIQNSDPVNHSELNALRDAIEKQWTELNLEYPEQGKKDYLSGINDGIYWAARYIFINGLKNEK